MVIIDTEVVCSAEAFEAELMKYLKSCLWQNSYLYSIPLRAFSQVLKSKRLAEPLSFYSTNLHIIITWINWDLFALCLFPYWKTFV